MKAHANKRIRAALLLLPITLLVSGSLLLGWGVDDLPGFFRNSARTGLIVVIFASYLVGALLGIELNPFRAGKTQGRKWPIIVGASAVPFAFAAVSFCDRRGVFVLPDLSVIRWTGVVALAFGDSIRLAALRELGKEYSMFLTIQKEHELVRTGVYRRIRHPFYLGALFTAPGMMLALRSEMAVIAFLLSIIFIASRISREEKLLIDQFPEEYSQYRRSSWRLLPYVY
ncbi:MAG: isoprenylcysteine carboxylmethyltransferase family protein [Bryobacteraceae bacterium]